MAGTYLVEAGACTACGACLLTRPASAFVVGVPLAVDPSRCTDCGACVEVCPADAVTRVAPASGPSLIFASSSPAPARRSARDEDQRRGGGAGVAGRVRA